MQAYEQIIRVQPKGVITLPKKLREKIGLKDNGFLRLREIKGKVTMETIRTIDYPVRTYKAREIKSFLAMDEKESKELKKKEIIVKVLFNASVIIAGLHSSTGSSAKLIRWAKKKKIAGLISEIIFDEVWRHKHLLKLSKEELGKQLETTFEIYKAPPLKFIKLFEKTVTDFGDAHVLASYKQLNCQALVSLDKKHILSLQGKLKKVNIYTPGEFIKKFSS